MIFFIEAYSVDLFDKYVTNKFTYEYSIEVFSAFI